jgi:GGDEF domain-containing protein
MLTPGSGQRAADAGAVGYGSDAARGDGSSVDVGLLDPTTGLLSVSAWEVVLDHEAARLTRYNRPVSIVAVEVEGLEALSRALGDAIAINHVRAVAEILRRLTSPPDVVARADDGVFLVLLIEAAEAARLDFVKRLRAACDLWLEAAHPGTRLAVHAVSPNATQSLGVAVRVALEGVRAASSRAYPSV